MVILVIGFIIGTILSWAGMILAVNRYKYKNTEQDNLIKELAEENAAYKKVIEKWRNTDKTFRR